MLKKILSKLELGRFLRVSTRTIDRLCGEGCPVKDIGYGKRKVLRFDLDEVMEWLESRTGNELCGGAGNE